MIFPWQPLFLMWAFQIARYVHWVLVGFEVQSPAMAKMSNRRWRVASCHCTLTLPQRVTLSKSNFQIMKISSLTLASFAPYSRTLGSLSRPCSRKMDRSKSRAMAQRGYLFGTIALVTGSAMDNVAQQNIPGIVCWAAWATVWTQKFNARARAPSRIRSTPRNFSRTSNPCLLRRWWIWPRQFPCRLCWVHCWRNCRRTPSWWGNMPSACAFQVLHGQQLWAVTDGAWTLKPNRGLESLFGSLKEWKNCLATRHQHIASSQVSGDDRCASDPKAPIQKHLLGCCSHLKPAPSTTLATAYRKWVESISYHVSSPTGSCTLCTFNWSYDHVEIQWNTMTYPCLEPLRKSQRDSSCSLLQLSCNFVRYFKAFQTQAKVTVTIDPLTTGISWCHPRVSASVWSTLGRDPLHLLIKQTHVKTMMFAEHFTWTSPTTYHHFSWLCIWL